MADRRHELIERYGEKAVPNLERLVEYCDVLATIVTEAVGVEGLEEERVQWAAEMGLIRIGETVNRLPGQLLLDYPDQPWRVIIAMRNMAAHQYDDLDASRLWRTLTNDVPALRRYVQEAILGQDGRPADAPR